MLTPSARLQFSGVLCFVKASPGSLCNFGNRPKMWRKSPEFRVEKRAQNFVRSLVVAVFSVRNQRKTKGQQLKGKSVLALFHTFWHFSTHLHFFFSQSFSDFFLQDFFARIKGFHYCFSSKRRKEKKREYKENTKPFCMWVVARLSSDERWLKNAVVWLSNFALSGVHTAPCSGEFISHMSNGIVMRTRQNRDAPLLSETLRNEIHAC